jgi:EAL domain-containing protein (putative c-di-GMP-specific phosphodiesterase class I)
MVRISHTLGLRVVAEGVETEAIKNHLRDLGCDQAQGFWLGKPCPADQFYGPSPSDSLAGKPATSM